MNKNTETQKIIASNLKRLRVNDKLSQQAVADFLGIKRATYANYENGRRHCPVSIIEKLTNLYGCDDYDIFCEHIEKVAQNINLKKIKISDLKVIANFNAIVKNYFKILKIFKNKNL